MIIRMDGENLPPYLETLKRRRAPASEMLGFDFVEADLEEGWARVSFQPTDDFRNPWGAVQGGLLAAMLDELMGAIMGLYCDWGEVITTLELKVSMLTPAQPDTIFGLGRIIKRGKSIIFAEGELRDKDDTLIAKASSTGRIVTLKRKRKNDDT